MGEQLNLGGIPRYLTPHFGRDGIWATAGALAIKDSLRRGDAEGVMDVLDSMNPNEMATTLCEAGFVVSLSVADKGRDAVLEAVQSDLAEAIDLHVDGYGLNDSRASLDFTASGVAGTGEKYFLANFASGHEAMKMIQDVMRSDSVSVDLFGDASPGERASLVFVAGQAVQKGLQGFGFDGIAGKYVVPLSMAEVAGLHREAARAVAEESARSALGIWANGGKVNEVSEWVPDSVQRLLYGSLSVATASAVVNAIEGGMVGRHAGEMGTHGFARLLAEQGFDVKAATVDVQAKELGLTLVEPDTNRGQYVGPVVGLDHRSALIKFARDKGVGLPFKDLAQEQARPGLGDTVRMKFKAGDLTVSMAPKIGRGEMGR